MSDCYVLAPDRAARSAREFLERFVPAREATWDPIDPAQVLGMPPDSSLEDILGFLEQHADRAYVMYLRNRDAGPPFYAVLAYNGDGTLVLGLSGDDDERAAAGLLARLEAFAGSAGYWAMEEAPPESREAFLARARKPT